MKKWRSRTLGLTFVLSSVLMLLLAFQNCSGFSAIPLNISIASSQIPGASTQPDSTTRTAVALPAPTTVPSTSWFGNSFGQSSQVMQIDVESLFVSQDGHVFTNAYWSETGTQSGIYKNKSSLAFMAGLQGWGRTGGYAVTASDAYVYISMTQSGCESSSLALNLNGLPQYPDCGTTWIAIRRYDHTGNAAPFPGGVGYDGSMKIITTMPSADTRVIQNAIPKGLAIRGTTLYVSDPFTNQIMSYDSNSLEKTGSFAAVAPGPIAIDTQGNFWIIQSSGQVNRFTSTGQVTAISISVKTAVGLAFDSNDRLLIADGGPDQNVKIFGSLTTNPVLVDTLGEARGSAGGNVPGAMGDLRFNGLTGVGTDSIGNIYISQNGKGVQRDSGFNFNTELRSFSSDRKLNWNLFSNEYVNGGVFDPISDGTSIYTTYMHYNLKSDGEVGLPANPDFVTFDRFTYPNDPRNHLGLGFLHPVALRWINGKKFLFMASMFPAGLFIYRFTGNIAVPAGIISSGSIGDTFSKKFPPNQPATGSWIWRDADGDVAYGNSEFETGDSLGNDRYGWWIDLNGDIWQGTSAGIRKFTVQGLDTVGNPIYHLANSRVFELPTGYSVIGRLIHDSATDTLYVTGFENGESDDGCFGTVGKAISRINNFSTAPKFAWTTRIPYLCSTGQASKAIDIAGNALFSAESTDGGSGGGLIRVYDLSSGVETVHFSPGAAVGGSKGVSWTDIPNALHAYERANGQYILLNEDDLYGKIVSYFW